MLFLLFFRHLKVTLDSEQPKEERIIPSVRGGINVLNIFKEASIFLIIVHSSCELMVLCFAFHRRAELKPACILLLVVTVTFFTCPDFLIYLHVAEPAFSEIDGQQAFSRRKEYFDPFSVAQVIIVRSFIFLFLFLI